MNTKTLSKIIEIQANKEKVWKILTEQPYVDEWTSALMPNTKVAGEFKEGAHIIYTDGTTMGVVGEISEFKPTESLKILVVGEAKDGALDIDNPDNKKWKGCFDHYVINENNGVTTFSAESAVPAEFYDVFAEGWNKMVDTVKEVAER